MIEALEALQDSLRLFTGIACFSEALEAFTVFATVSDLTDCLNTLWMPCSRLDLTATGILFCCDIAHEFGWKYASTATAGMLAQGKD